MSNQPQNKKTRFLSPSAIRNSWKSFRSRSSSSNNAAQIQTGQSAHASPSGTRSPSPEGHHADVPSSLSASVAVVGSSKHDPSSSPQVNEFAKDVLSGGYEVVKILKECSGLCPPLKTALSGFIECIELYKRTSGNHEEMERILKIISDLGSELAVKLVEPRDQKALDRVMKKLLKSLEEEDRKIKAMLERGFLGRLAHNSDHAGELVSSCNAIKDALHLFFVGLTLLIERNTRDILKNIVFQTLPRSHDAAFTAAINLDNISRGPCTKDTRVDVIKQIMEWVKETDSTKAPSVYWLTGLAGLGKTTIAYTICEELKATGLEFVSFFCSCQLDSKNSKLLITTICRDLAALFSSFASELLPVLEKDSNIAHARLPLQMEELFTNPWKASLSHRQCLPLPVVVVDALDESDHGTEFLKVLLDAVDLGELSGIKFLVTSRPEPTLFDLCKSFPPNAVCKLHEIDVSNVQKDIEKYLFSALPDLKNEPNIVKLASQAQGFFIYAATAVRFISSPSQPFSVHEKRKQLQNIVNSWPVSSRGSEHNAVNELYQKILGDAFSDEHICDERLPILHTVLCAESRITMSVIAHLSDNDQDTVEKTIESLHSVLFISSKDECVYWYHTSFLDFIFTQVTAKFSIFLKQGCPSQEINVFCDKVAHHAILACQCFIIMRKLLYFNMCNLKSSFQFDSDVLGLNGEKLKNLSPVLQYASRHWATHLSQAATADDESNELLQFLDDFMCNKLLFWIEAMNLIGHKFECASSLKDAEEWFKKGIKPLGLLEYLSDAASFSAHFAGSHASKSTPHLYISALSTWYQKSPVWTHWKHQFTALPSIILLNQDVITVPLLTITTKERISCAAVSGKGDQIVCSCYCDSSLLVWDTKTGHLLKKLKGHTDHVWSVAFSSNGNQIVSGSTDNSIRLWDARTGYQMLNLQGHNSGYPSVAFSPDCYKVACSSDDVLVNMWDTKTGKLLRQLEGSGSELGSVVFSPDSNIIASGYQDGSVWVWDARIGEYLRKMKGHRLGVSSVSFSPDSHKIASGSFDSLILVWDADTGHILSKLQGHSDCVLSVTFSPDGNQIISGSEDHSICVWDAKKGHQLRKLQGHTNEVTSVTFLPDGDKIISSSYDGVINVWDAKTGQLREQEGHSNSVTSVSLSPDGQQIASGSRDNSIRLWDMKSGHQIKELQGHTNHVMSVMFSPDGNQIVSGSLDWSIKIWDVKTGDQLKILQGHAGWISSVAFSPDGCEIASGSQDHSICLWDTKTGYQLKILQGHTDIVASVAFSPQGDYIASGSWDQLICVWDVEMDHCLMKLQGHTHSVYSVTFSSDGRQIMSCSDLSIRLWDVKTGQQAMQLHTLLSLSAAFSPDNHQIVSASHESVQVWDAKTGQKLRVLKGHTDFVNSVAFSPDGSQIVSGSSDHSVRVWNADTDDQQINFQECHNQIDLVTSLNNNNQISSISEDQFINVSANSHVDTSWVINEDGWICFASNKLIWIPSTIRKVLHHPHSILIISRLGSAKISFKDSKLGSLWHECYTS